jgi:hypothetical protein
VREERKKGKRKAIMQLLCVNLCAALRPSRLKKAYSSINFAYTGK